MKFSQSRIGSIIGGVFISIFLVADWTDPVNRTNMLEKALILVK